MAERKSVKSRSSSQRRSEKVIDCSNNKLEQEEMDNCKVKKETAKKTTAALTTTDPTEHNLTHQNSISAFAQLNDQKDHCYAHIPKSGLSMFLTERTKVIHFIRHAEGIHNEANGKAGSNRPTIFSTKGSNKFWDAPLTSKGKLQCQRVRQELEAERANSSGRGSKNIQLVVVSPLVRTLQTAQIIFGEANCQDSPPFIVHELCRERYGFYTCDGRNNISDTRKRFPRCIDFDSFCPVDKDTQWSEVRESDESVMKRALEFVTWLSTRPEQEIAVVTHSSWLRHLFSQFGGNVVKEDKMALQRLAGNAELRSVTLCSHTNPTKVVTTKTTTRGEL